jgi:hypothetical protein
LFRETSLQCCDQSCASRSVRGRVDAERLVAATCRRASAAADRPVRVWTGGLLPERKTSKRSRYTFEAKAGMTIRTYVVVWRGARIVAVEDLGMR